MKSLRALLSISVVVGLFLLPRIAQADEPATGSVPMSGMLGFETLHLPNGERMGLVGGTVLFDIGADWGLGPGVYGAASGRRGGFFVGGVELQRRWGLAPGWSLATGVFAGGGGGAAAPVGGGLMLRPAVTLLTDLGPSLQLGLSWSSVRFPSGQIGSNQFGLALAWRNEFLYFAGAEGSPAPTLSQATGLGFDRMSATASSYHFSDGSGRRIGLAGARAERRSDIDGFTWGLEAAAAASGNAAGYMELLGSAAYSVPIWPSTLPSWRAGLRLGAGLAGGGAVPTGGGVIGKAAATMEFSPSPGWTVGGELGRVRGMNGSLRARQAQVWVGLDLEPGLDARSDTPGRVLRTEWIGVLQHHAGEPRRDGSRQSLDTVGLKLNRYLGEHLYLSGQAHSAFAGGAGAYSVGLVGAGLATRPQAALRAGAEVLIGAAGGGGIQTAGGSIIQAMAWSGWQSRTAGEWRVGLGATHGVRGGHTTPLVELSWSHAFGMAGR